MSTAGKVLTVLVLLVMLGWVILMSAVTQLNVNWQQKILALDKDLDRATLEFTKAKDDTLSLTEQARLLQDLTDREVRVRLGRIALIERRKSSHIEDLTRIKQQVADALASVETAKANLAIREAEKVKNQENLAKIRDEITKLQASNAESKAQLAQLQDDFKRLLAENAAKLDKAAKESAVKPASSLRTPPSS